MASPVSTSRRLSMTATTWPCSLSRQAVDSPAMPDPTTTSRNALIILPVVRLSANALTRPA